MAKQNWLDTWLGVIAREIVKDGVNQQNKNSQQGTLVNSEITSSEDP